LSDKIRELFPALVMLEEVGPQRAGPPGACSGRMTADGSALERLGDYRILREVARGGMGVVYEAEQEALGRHVALKVLPYQSPMDPIRLQRFRRESRSAARLHHTNIVPVFDVGEFEGTHYYAMQFIRGQALDEVLTELKHMCGVKAEVSATGPADDPALTPMRQLTVSLARGLLTGEFSRISLAEEEVGEAPPQPASPDAEVIRPEAGSGRIENPSYDPVGRIGNPSSASAGASSGILKIRSDLSSSGDSHYFRSAAQLGLQVAEALAYAHAQKVLHRDIKPANLLLDFQGTVWVTDFGLAKEEGEDLTQTGDLVGTLRYMAPERFNGESDPRSDIYGLGLTLYELLTLRPAFEESDHSRLIRRIVHEDPVRPRKRDPQIPRDLETIVLKAVAKDPKERYQVAEEMAEDLRRFLADRPIQARRSAVWEHAWRWCRRNPLVAGLLTLVALLLTAVATVSLVSAVQLNQALEQTRDAEGEARLREAEALLGQAHGIRLSRRPGQRFDALAALGKAAAIGRELGQPPAWFDRLRSEAIAALALPDVHITQEFGSFPPGSVEVDLSDDFELYVRTTDKGSCTIRRVADDTQAAHLPPLGEPVEAQFGSGRILAVYAVQSHRFQLWDLSGTEPIRRFEEPGISHRRFRNDGRLLALSHTDGSISVYETASGKRMHRLGPGQIVSKLDPALHPTEPFVACCSYLYRDVQVRDLRSGAVVAAAVPPWPGGSHACWCPDGRRLLVADCNGGIIQEYAFEPAAPALKLLRSIQGPIMPGAELQHNPAGDRFVRQGWDNVVVLFDAFSGQEAFRTHSLPPALHSPLLRFDRTGQRLAAARIGDRNDRIGLWSVADVREYRSLVHAGSAETHHGVAPAIHPRGRLAAMSLTDGVALFDLESGRELAHLAITAKGCWVSFDGTGSLLTNGFEGFFRWSVRPDPVAPSRLVLGPPQRLPFNPGSQVISASRDGRVVAQCMWAGYGTEAYAGGWILHPNCPTPRRVDPGHGKGFCSVSPDDRWVAFGLHDDPIKVYDAATGQCVWQSPGGQGLADHDCRFTPDRRWLVTSMDGGRVYAAGTWEPGPQLGPGRPCDVTSELAVMRQRNGFYRLVELATGRELARLEDPEQNTGAAAFTPDGTKLVVAAKNGLRVWDLRRIRTELAKMKLDWHAPPYPPADPAPATALQVVVDTADLGMTDAQRRAYWQRHIAVNTIRLALNPFDAQAALRRGRAYAHLGEKSRAVDDFASALVLLPPDKQAFFAGTLPSEIARELNDWARRWAVKPAPKKVAGQSQKALFLARKAVELAPDQWLYRNTLGVVHYRLGNFAEAVKHLELGLDGSKGDTAGFDLFFLAMCHQRLRNAGKARECYGQAVRWVEKEKAHLPPGWIETLNSFRAEAAGVLGLAKP
jgi:tetratricopeptide (TPR) repeat protein/tRNA A-37 threonylcarbamoyl transferase component Bud32